VLEAEVVLLVDQATLLDEEGPAGEAAALGDDDALVAWGRLDRCGKAKTKTGSEVSTTTWGTITVAGATGPASGEGCLLPALRPRPILQVGTLPGCR
jgi:hypothetical protein